MLKKKSDKTAQKTLAEKREALKEQIAKQQVKLRKLEETRKLEIGVIAFKCGLADVADDVLAKEFAEIAKRLV